MASPLPVLCSSLSPSSAQPLVFSSRAQNSLQKGFVSNIRGRQSANSSCSALARQGDEKCSQEVQFSIGSLNGSMIKTLGGIACGVFVAASVAWDALPAFADDLPPVSAVTPYSKSADRMQVGLIKGRIQACPLDINPNCVSTSSNNRGYSAPWIIPESSNSNAAKKIETAILSTQKNPAIVQVEEIPEIGTYLVAEADGFLGRDVMEFLVKEDVVTYRSMAKKVVYVYPFTTPIGDFDGQQRRLKTLEEELGWSTPSFENTYYDQEYD